jgi:hypothetical protein
MRASGKCDQWVPAIWPGWPRVVLPSGLPAPGREGKEKRWARGSVAAFRRAETDNRLCLSINFLVGRYLTDQVG